MFCAFLSSTRSSSINHTHAHTPTVYNYKTKSATLFRSLRVLSSSLLELCLYKLFCALPSSTRSSSVNHTHAHTRTYSVQLQNQERHSVQKPQSTKQLSAWSCVSTSCSVLSFQYSKFLSKPHTRAHTHLQCTTTKPRAPLCSETSEY